MDPTQKDIINYFTKVGQTAEEILVDKERLVDLNRSSNALREAKRALERLKKSGCKDSKVYICVGNTFIKVPRDRAYDIIEKDWKFTEDERKKIRDDLNPKVENLRNLEGESEIPGFNLNPLSKDELSSIKSLLTPT